MTGKTDAFRANADMCEHMATTVIGKGDRAEWLDLAWSWRSLLEMNEKLEAKPAVGRQRS